MSNSNNNNSHIMRRQGDSHVTSGRSIEPGSDSILLMDRVQEMSIRKVERWGHSENNCSVRLRDLFHGVEPFNFAERFS
jgi:hypothetical protein